MKLSKPLGMYFKFNVAVFDWQFRDDFDLTRRGENDFSKFVLTEVNTYVIIITIIANAGKVLIEFILMT